MPRPTNKFYDWISHRVVRPLSRIIAPENTDYSVGDQLIIKRLTGLPSCMYTDENPSRSPEQFAQQFRSQSMLTWLYQHHDHPLFVQQNTTALHTLVRLQDVHGIGVLAKRQVDMNIKETASGLSCLNLLTGMCANHQSRVFFDAQRNRLHMGRRDSLFATLCQYGATIDLGTLIHIMTDCSTLKRRQFTCWHYFMQHHQDALFALCSTHNAKRTSYSQWKTFCTDHLGAAFKRHMQHSDHTRFQNYSRDQLKKVLTTIVEECSGLLYDMRRSTSLHETKITAIEPVG